VKDLSNIFISEKGRFDRQERSLESNQSNSSSKSFKRKALKIAQGKKIHDKNDLEPDS